MHDEEPAAALAMTPPQLRTIRPVKRTAPLQFAPAAALVLLSHAALADPGVDLGGHRHVDLSAATPAAPPKSAKALPVTTTLPATPQACGDEAPGQIRWLGEDTVAERRGERERLDTTGGRVSRKGDALTLVPAAGKPVRFADRVVPATRTTDGDATRFQFAGLLAGTRFWRVESDYQHDSPGSWLIDPANGDAFYTHNGGAAAVLSVDGHWLAVAELLNAPYQITLTELAATPAAVKVDCRVGDGTRGAFAACGFDADGGFRFSWTGEDTTVTALRLAHDKAGAWELQRPAGTTTPAIRCVELP